MECRELWQEYKEKHTKRAREDLILKYLPLVKHIAHSMAINFPSHIIVDDIINDGIMGLIGSLQKENEVLETLDYHGIINFYCDFKGKWYEFYAKFTDGRLVSITGGLENEL